ncbi:MAG: iron-sulfur cluster assembly accessory protein [Bacteroidia bacterium]|nr:iron-sulfur cluster assembly accessory protein [Bacteroidia bacterium]MCX7652368.1 iron-sulfur cluster assembly accessory protein [Bacteroidia bacterium]MDW8417658.1 iron-sulfur cluster assembly accessory protein [Bacteroidia bacterium]
MTLTLTPSAEAELKRIWQAAGDAIGFRIAVEAGGCAGLTYKLELIAEPDPADERIEVGGIPFFIHPTHQILLSGLSIDYPQGLAARGFVFQNPQARSTCGCGTSFSV